MFCKTKIQRDEWNQNTITYMTLAGLRSLTDRENFLNYLFLIKVVYVLTWIHFKYFINLPSFCEKWTNDFLLSCQLSIETLAF